VYHRCKAVLKTGVACGQVGSTPCKGFISTPSRARAALYFTLHADCPTTKGEDAMTEELQVGVVGESIDVVRMEHTATAMRSGDVPVYATPALAALLEEAACAAIAPFLDADKTTVGVRIDLRHLAASPIGATIRAQARLTQIEGRRLTFRVMAWDETEQVADGHHERMLVDRTRFLQRVGVKGDPGSKDSRL
jgi:predicted thioesterase